MLLNLAGALQHCWQDQTQTYTGIFTLFAVGKHFNMIQKTEVDFLSMANRERKVSLEGDTEFKLGG